MTNCVFSSLGLAQRHAFQPHVPRWIVAVDDAGLRELHIAQARSHA
jgi:hypothetical protein